MAGILSTEQYSLYFRKVGLLYKRPEIRASLEVILSVFTVAFLIFVAIRPTLANVVSLQKKISDQEVVNKKANNKMAQLISAQNQLTIFANDLGLLDAAVPDNFTYTDDARRLEYVARLNNLTIDSLNFPGVALLASTNVTAASWITKVAVPTANNTILDQVTFSVEGKPQNVITFLSAIENMDRLAGINSVSLTKQIGTEKSADVLKASGQVTFYFYTESK